MRIVRFRRGSSQPTLGCVEGEDVYLLRGTVEAPEPGERIAPLQSVRLLAPCAPSKVIAAAINFPGIEGYTPEMPEPMIFAKPGSSVCGPGDPVVNPFPELPWWGEAELAVVMRTRLRNADENEARAAVLGFTIANDVTVENVWGRDHHLARSKCADTFCPLGPWIDTEFDASDCIIEAIQNGEVIRRASSAEQVWTWPTLVSRVSRWMTLEPGDVILTGNPPDTVGMRFVQHGDTYTARVHGLGELTNRFFVEGEPRDV